MIAELDQVVLTRDVPEVRRKAGDVGTVVLAHRAGTAFEVEFMTLDGETVAVLTLEASDLRPITPRELVHARAAE